MPDFDTIIRDIIFDSPPGEIQDVYRDLITIVGENSKETILDTIQEYNVENNLPIEVNNEEAIIISKYNKKDNSKFIDFINGQCFEVDPLTRQALNTEPLNNVDNNYDINEMKSLSKKLEDYTKQNFPGKCSLAVHPIEASKYMIYIVSTKYNPSNFWNGHWTSNYIWNHQDNSITGNIKVQVHYYEDGNVSFKSEKHIDIINGMSDENQVLKSISEVEKLFENELDQAFTRLNETQFKGLRRRLPVTRSKVSWGKAIGNYRLGKDAASYEK